VGLTVSWVGGWVVSGWVPGTRWLGALWFRQTLRGGGWLFSASATRSRVVIFWGLVDTVASVNGVPACVV